MIKRKTLNKNTSIQQVKRKVFVFGNPDMPGDALAVQLVPELRKSFPEIEFKVVDPNELDLLEEKEIIVLDVVEGLKEVRWIEIEELAKTGEQMTTHDFDASTYLLLMKKLNPNISIRILGVPIGEKEATILTEVERMLS